MFILQIYSTLGTIVQRYINIKSPCHMPGKYEFFHPPLQHKPDLLQRINLKLGSIIFDISLDYVYINMDNML